MPAEPVSFDELKRATSIEYVASWLNLDLKPEGRGELRTGCPVHGSKRGLAIIPNWVNKDGSVGKFTCWGCKPEQHGDLIGLVSHVNEIKERDAALLLKHHLWPAVEKCPDLRDLQHDHEAIVSWGMPTHVMKVLEGGYNPRGTQAKCVSIPLRTPNGEKVCYIGIPIELLPQMRLPKKFFL